VSKHLLPPVTGETTPRAANNACDTSAGSAIGWKAAFRTNQPLQKTRIGDPTYIPGPRPIIHTCIQSLMHSAKPSLCLVVSTKLVPPLSPLSHVSESVPSPPPRVGHGAPSRQPSRLSPSAPSRTTTPPGNPSSHDM
ncbi:hypothetical protein Vretifemale_18813, partial [Volvox reticuliferus]